MQCILWGLSISIQDLAVSLGLAVSLAYSQKWALHNTADGMRTGQWVFRTWLWTLHDAPDVVSVGWHGEYSGLYCEPCMTQLISLGRRWWCECVPCDGWVSRHRPNAIVIPSRLCSASHTTRRYHSKSHAIQVQCVKTYTNLYVYAFNIWWYSLLKLVKFT